MSKLFCVFILGISSLTAIASSDLIFDRPRFELRFESATAFDSKLDETVRYAHVFFPWLEAEAALRLAQTGFNLSAMQYQGEIRFPFLSFFAISTRLNHSSYFSAGFSSTNWGIKAELHGKLFFWEPFIEGGWYHRFNRLSGTSPLPTFDGSFSENHFMLMVGNHFQLTDSLRLSAFAGTFETIDIFNLNNPYGQIGLTYQPEPNLTVTLFSRYRMLLGFGRRDSWLWGAGLSLPLELFDGSAIETDGAS